MQGDRLDPVIRLRAGAVRGNIVDVVDAHARATQVNITMTKTGSAVKLLSVGARVRQGGDIVSADLQIPSAADNQHASLRAR